MREGVNEGRSVGCFTPYRQLDSFSRRKNKFGRFLGLKQVWIDSVLGDLIYEMKHRIPGSAL